MARGVEDWDGDARAWRSVPRLAGTAIAAPLVVGFVTLGAAVVVLRSLRDLARASWRSAPPRDDDPGPRP